MMIYFFIKLLRGQMDTVFQIEEIQQGCTKCGEFKENNFTFAYQPIVDIHNQEIFGYEALVRDRVTKTAKAVLDKVNAENRYAFDQTCRVKAISMANQLGLDRVLSINFLPNAVYEPKHCIQSTIRAAEMSGFPLDKIMFEVTESEKVYDTKHLKNIFDYYQSKGFVTALDDFGAGHAGLNMLINFIPNIIKLDMELVRDVDSSTVKQVVVNTTLEMAKQLNITVLAEGVETLGEAKFFAEKGVYLMQGYLFAKPGYESLPGVSQELLAQVSQSFTPN